MTPREALLDLVALILSDPVLFSLALEGSVRP